VRMLSGRFRRLHFHLPQTVPVGRSLA
jgi:hypothetical protein